MQPRTHDVNGRPYARLGEIRRGTLLEADDGFAPHDDGDTPCLADGARVRVRGRRRDSFYVPCRAGCHRLDGQLEDGTDILIGFYRCEAA